MEPASPRLSLPQRVPWSRALDLLEQEIEEAYKLAPDAEPGRTVAVAFGFSNGGEQVHARVEGTFKVHFLRGTEEELAAMRLLLLLGELKGWWGVAGITQVPRAGSLLRPIPPLLFFVLRDDADCAAEWLRAEETLAAAWHWGQAELRASLDAGPLWPGTPAYMRR